MSSFDDRPKTVARLSELMTNFPADWALCGGWAVDAWLGRQTRDHLDIDLVVFQEEQHAVFEYFDGWQLLGHDDNVPGATEEQWDGHHLDLPSHIHARGDGFDLDIQINERTEDEWVFSREPRVILPLSRSIEQSSWGLSIAGPEVLIYYKALPPGWRSSKPPRRPHDEVDFEAMLPHLSDAQREWLRDAIALAEADHPWLPRLAR